MPCWVFYGFHARMSEPLANILLSGYEGLRWAMFSLAICFGLFARTRREAAGLYTALFVSVVVALLTAFWTTVSGLTEIERTKFSGFLVGFWLTGCLVTLATFETRRLLRMATTKILARFSSSRSPSTP